MIGYEVKVLDEKDLMFVSDLRNLGISRNVALTIVYLCQVEEASSRNIEIGTGLRQPEISIAIRFMAENQWVESKMLKDNKKGRPLRVYSISVPMDRIYQYYEALAHENYDKSAEKIERLKKLVCKKDKK
ncbi:MAG: transcriptional regulator protein [Methanimicrococcus sp.]|nr:transcriptional regulator protein [Methanimicrococcus sp.]